MAPAWHAGVDLGAGSGRVLLGAIDDHGVTLSEVHRFRYTPRRIDAHLRWDVTQLFDGIRAGLGRAAEAARAAGGDLRSAGVDSWGVDYGIVDEQGRLLEEPICYRDERTTGMMERACSLVPREAIFESTGIQFLSFNTIFQLLAHVEEGLPGRASRVLMIPDLCHHFLCGSATSEQTNASTTQLLRMDTADWDDTLLSALGIPRALMPPVRPPGATLGGVRDDLRRELGLPSLQIVQPATHDTGSAVAGTPLEAGWAYISSGTWSLVGVERRTPLAGGDVLSANFTNERGIDGTFRFLKNVAGLWLLESCRREWQAAGMEQDLAHLLGGAAALPAPAGLVYPDAARFFNPSSMLRELRDALRESGQAAPEDPIAITRIILDSLALRYASVISAIERLTGDPIAGVHVVGGGSLNDYLNQATADATGRPVAAGPVEATSLGNIIVQAASFGEMSVSDARRAIGRSFAPRRYAPRDRGMWESARERYRQLEDGAQR